MHNALRSDTHQVRNLAIQPGGNKVQMCDQQSGVNPHVQSQIFKRARFSESMSNARMPLSTNRSRLPVPFKTELCLQFKRGNCSYEANCHFAHGIEELRKLPSNRLKIAPQKDGCRNGNSNEDHRNVGKTNACWKYVNGEKCPFGHRCQFLHEALPRSSHAISIASTGSDGDCRSGAAQWEDGKFVNSHLNANRVYQRPVYWKTKLCNKWETSGRCPYGQKCYFAHGQAELQKLVTLYAPEPGCISASKPRTISPEDSPCCRREIGTTHHQTMPGKKCSFKWTNVEKIGRIYADWINNMPLVCGSTAEVGS